MKFVMDNVLVDVKLTNVLFNKRSVSTSFSLLSTVHSVIQENWVRCQYNNWTCWNLFQLPTVLSRRLDLTCLLTPLKHNLPLLSTCFSTLLLLIDTECYRKLATDGHHFDTSSDIIDLQGPTIGPNNNILLLVHTSFDKLTDTSSLLFNYYDTINQTPTQFQKLIQRSTPPKEWGE